MIKIKEYRVQQQGMRGRVLTLPKIWIDDNALKPGDVIEFYRTGDEHDSLVIRPKRKDDGR